MKAYVKPEMQVEEFRPSEYVAACYKIKCETPNGNSRYKSLAADTNGNGVYDAGEDEIVYTAKTSFWGCGNWHKHVIRDSAPTANGFVVRGRGADTETAPVFYWEERFGDGSIDYHVMTPGDENYETNPNAS